VLSAVDAGWLCCADASAQNSKAGTSKSEIGRSGIRIRLVA